MQGYLCTALLFALVWIILLAVDGSAREITVDDDGGADFETIQDAINASVNGDTVRVFEGTYHENVIINTSIELIGNGSEGTIINGGGTGVVVTINADRVAISGFSITGGKERSTKTGISTRSDHIRISSNNFTNNGYPIFISDSRNCTIDNNTFRNSSQGFTIFDSFDCFLDDNSFLSGSIYLSDSERCWIRNTTFREGGAVRLQESSRCVIRGTTFHSPDNAGISLGLSDHITVSENLLTGKGIQISSDFRGNVSHWNTHDIDETNTIDGKPIRFIKNASGMRITTMNGELFLVNCTRGTVENGHFDTGHIGITVGYSNNITIANSSFSNFKYGIHLIESRDCLIENNTCTENRDSGIFLLDSDYNTVANNSCSRNEFGIRFAGWHNSILNNNCSFNFGRGIRGGGWEDPHITGGSYSVITSIISHNVCNENGGAEWGSAGISVHGHRNTISWNECSWNDGSGISVSGTTGCFVPHSGSDSIIENNVCNWNEYTGIGISWENDIVRGNTLWGNGISGVSPINSNVDTSNTVNGKPVYCYVNESGITVREDAGQVMIINCTDMIVKHLVYTDFNQGLLVLDSGHIIIETCTFSGNSVGIDIRNSHHITVRNIDCSNNYNGIDIESSDNITISNSVFSKNSYRGMEVSNCENVRIRETVCNLNQFGIYQWKCVNSLIESVILNNNARYGMYVYRAEGDTIFSEITCIGNEKGVNIGNSKYILCENSWISENEMGIFLDYRCENNTFRNNKISKNSEGIVLYYMNVNNTFHGNDIFYNSVYGFNTTGNLGLRNDARLNWWGNESGPYHPILNPGGTGDRITDTITFEPWLTARTTNDTEEPPVTSPNQLFVSANASENGDGLIDTPFNMIQDAINVSREGTTIFVWEGVYYENVIVNRSVDLVGNGSREVTIDGDGNESVVSIIVDRVNISGFTVQNGVANHGIQITANYTRISDTICRMNHHGITIVGSNHCTIENNTSSLNNFIGIGLYDCRDSQIIHNSCSSQNGNGILLARCENITIEGNTGESNHNGIDLQSSENCTIRENAFSQNRDSGIRLMKSPNCTILDNTLFHNGLYGISFSNSPSCSLLKNSMIENGVFVSGNSENFSSCVIDSSNTVNGKPVYFFMNSADIIVPLGAGQIILVNTSSIIVENQNCSNGSMGIFVLYSSGITLRNNICSGNSQNGIHIAYSAFCSIENNIADTNGHSGVFIVVSDNCEIRDNVFSHNDGYGIYCLDSSLCVFENTTCPNNDIGIYISRSWGCVLMRNECLDGNNGISVSSSNDCLIEKNVCLNNSWGISLRYATNCVISSNVNEKNSHGIQLHDSSSVISNNICQFNVNGITISDSNNVQIMNNTFDNNSYMGIGLSDSSFCTIINNSCSNNSRGIDLSYATNNCTIMKNTISENRDGISCLGILDNITIQYNSIVNNVEFGIEVRNGEDNSIHAQYNWWGNATGPHHDTLNPGGGGDNISYNVIFDPWLDKFGNPVFLPDDPDDDETNWIPLLLLGIILTLLSFAVGWAIKNRKRETQKVESWQAGKKKIHTTNKPGQWSRYDWKIDNV